MTLHNVGYDHHHDADFMIERPQGSGDYLLLILKTASIFTLDGEDVYIPEKTFFLYPEGMPQYYRCVPQHFFANDWLHFQLTHEEREKLEAMGIPFAAPVPLDYTEFYSFCIKSIADEFSTGRLHRQSSIEHYFGLICNKVSERIAEHPIPIANSHHEMLLTVRNMVYANPFFGWAVGWGAHQTRMSVSAFYLHYKQQFGVTFMQDVIASRIAHAKMLLTTTDLSIHDIGLQCGYRNYEHFARQFKRECGISPGTFRKSLKPE